MSGLESRMTDESADGRPFSDALVRAATASDRIVVVSADLSKYTEVLPFARAFPERYFQLGMAEQNMMGVAGGLAKAGLVPVVVTFGVFATRRACDQFHMAIATGNHTVVVVGFQPGLLSPFRASHQATNDVSILRAVPNVTIIDPVDVHEAGDAVLRAVALPGPVYIRGLRGRATAPAVTPVGSDILRAKLIRAGGDIGIVSTGLATGWTMEAVRLLVERGINAGVLHVPTIKPIDSAAVIEFVGNYEHVFTVENHSVIGGLGSAVTEIAAGEPAAGRVLRLGIPDRWPFAGSLEYNRSELGLDAAGLAAAISCRLKE